MVSYALIAAGRFWVIWAWIATSRYFSASGKFWLKLTALWAKCAVDAWTTAAGVNDGAIFRRLIRLGKIWVDGITPKAIWHIVKGAGKRAGIKDLAPHDLRRTCVRLCHWAGEELEQIQFLLGHASVQTTERYLGCKKKLSQALNDNLGLDLQGP